DDAGAELSVDQNRVFDDRNLAIHDRQDCLLTLELCGSGIFRMDRESRISQHGLRPRRGDDGAGGNARHVVPNLVKRAGNRLTDYLEIGNGGPAAGTPVHDVASAVDQPLLIEEDERVADRARKIRIHGEPLPTPVERAAESPQLRLNRVFGLALPGPYALDEF